MTILFTFWISLPHFCMPAFIEILLFKKKNFFFFKHRETALLIDPKNSCSSSRQWVALVVGHELAHQWFGNLVTMVFNIFKCSNIFFSCYTLCWLNSISGLAGNLYQKSFFDRKTLFWKGFIRISMLIKNIQVIFIQQKILPKLF